MASLNQVELQNLRHLIGGHCTTSKKMSAYSSDCTDPQIKQMFADSATGAENAKQKLMGFLN